MTLHIFNPEHDIALAANLANFTAPHAGRQLRADLDFLPALWAQEGDQVLVENPDHAAKQWKRLVSRLVPTPGGIFPLRLGGKAEGLTRHTVEFFNERLTVIPADTLHGAGGVACKF